MNGAAPVSACTRFTAVQLGASAIEQNGVWRIKANAQFIAFVALQDRSRYGHEMNHVHDVASAIDSYLLDLERRSFSSHEACEQARIEAIDEFEKRVVEFVEASNRLRDGEPHPDR